VYCFLSDWPVVDKKFCVGMGYTAEIYQYNGLELYKFVGIGSCLFNCVKEGRCDNSGSR